MLSIALCVGVCGGHRLAPPVSVLQGCCQNSTLLVLAVDLPPTLQSLSRVCAAVLKGVVRCLAACYQA